MMRHMKLILAIGIVLAVSATAMATSKIHFSQPWGPDEIICHVIDNGMGTIYLPYNQPLNEWLDPADVPSVPASGANVGEDGWGIFQIDAIYKGKWVNEPNNVIDRLTGSASDLLWQAGDDGLELVGMYANRVDLAVLFAQDPISGEISQFTQSMGDTYEIFSQPVGNYDPSQGSSGRVMAGMVYLDKYTGIGYQADGTPLPGAFLEGTAYTEPGYFGSLAATEVISEFTPLGGTAVVTGTSDMFLTMDHSSEILFRNGGWLDEDVFHPTKGDPGEFNWSDLRLHVTTAPHLPEGDYDWLFTSSDPLTGAVMIPEPMTMLGVFMGISGLAGYVRKRRRD